MEAESSWVSIAQRAVSAHSSGVAVRRCGRRIVAIRIRAPLPADLTPAVCQGWPDLHRLAMN